MSSTTQIASSTGSGWPHPTYVLSKELVPKTVTVPKTVIVCKTAPCTTVRHLTFCNLGCLWNEWYFWYWIQRRFRVIPLTGKPAPRTVILPKTKSAATIRHFENPKSTKIVSFGRGDGFVPPRTSKWVCFRVFVHKRSRVSATVCGLTGRVVTEEQARSALWLFPSSEFLLLKT